MFGCPRVAGGTLSRRIARRRRLLPFRRRRPSSFDRSRTAHCIIRCAFSSSNSEIDASSGSRSRISAADFRLDADTGLVWKKNEPDEPIYQLIVGLEVHAQLDIPTKLFSLAPSGIGTGSVVISRPNSRVHPFDLAVPGYLPTLSIDAVRAAVIASAALGCRLPPTSRFERKHYAYADLPHGYQITQQRWPLAIDGAVEFQFPGPGPGPGDKKGSDPAGSSCRIERVQLEMDTAKTIATGHGGGESAVDFDRAGCALIEIVTKPDLRSPRQAAAMVSHLRGLLQHLGVCKGRMQDGHLRVDANVNLQRLATPAAAGDDEEEEKDAQRQWRTPRVEVKNLNSIQQVAAASSYEAMRQAALYCEYGQHGTDVPRGAEETRTWNATTSSTVLIRRKDQEDDYRFMPEPDLPPLVLDDVVKYYGHASLDAFLNAQMPERPEVTVKRLQEQYGYTDKQASVLANHNDPSALRLLEDVLQRLSSSRNVVDGDDSHQQKQRKQFAKLAFNLMVNELFFLVKEQAGGHDQEANLEEHNAVTADQMAELLQMLLEGSISKTMGKKILQLLFHEKHVGEDPRQVASEHNLALLSDPDKLREVCRRAVAEHPEELAKYQRGGKFAVKMRKFFTGQAMAATEYNAHPERLQEALEEILEEVAPNVE